MNIKKNSPIRDKIVRNLKTSLLGDTDYLTSINLPSWRYCSVKLFWSSLGETQELHLKEILKHWNWKFFSYNCQK